ncbi:MAG: hypothetical protein E7263_09350 [Lachnospiraceae bacterium]|nr:hypothetical protein [Lachnospiraceae bacterium]
MINSTKKKITLIIGTILILCIYCFNQPTEASESMALSGQAHIQTYGDTAGEYKDDILTLGTTGQAKRLESVTINFENNTEYEGNIQYRVHRQTYGWTDWVDAGNPAGTKGQGKRLEGIQIRLTGELANHYSVKYRVHIQTYGWKQGWQYDGALAGTEGEAKRLESLEVQLVPKTEEMGLIYRVHRQTYGWEMPYKTNGITSGTTGQAKRLEGIEIALTGNKYSGSVIYTTHVQSYGWMDEVSNGMMSGTSGQAKRLESIKIKLVGEIANYYDIYYRVHAQSFGWLGWAKNGEPSGTAGYGKRLEAIQVLLVEKDKTVSSDYEGIESISDYSYYDKSVVDKCNHDWEDVWKNTYIVGEGHVETKTLYYDGAGEKYHKVDVDERENYYCTEIHTLDGEFVCYNLNAGSNIKPGESFLDTYKDENGNRINLYSTGGDDLLFLNIGTVPEGNCGKCYSDYKIHTRFSLLEKDNEIYHYAHYHNGGSYSNPGRSRYIQVKELKKQIYVEDVPACEKEILVRSECSKCGYVKNLVSTGCSHEWQPKTQILSYEEMGHYEDQYYYEDGTLCNRPIGYGESEEGRINYSDCYSFDGIEFYCDKCEKVIYDYRYDPDFFNHLNEVHINTWYWYTFRPAVTPIITKVNREINYVMDMPAYTEEEVYMYTCKYCGATKGK